MRLVNSQGPPEHIFDPHGLPLPEGETHIDKIWFMKGDEEICAELAGALHGEWRNLPSALQLPHQSKTASYTAAMLRCHHQDPYTVSNFANPAGEERDKLWDSQKGTLAAMEAAEADP